jgi:tetratricopeptide (TPR) repeat protein
MLYKPTSWLITYVSFISAKLSSVTTPSRPKLCFCNMSHSDHAQPWALLASHEVLALIERDDLPSAKKTVETIVQDPNTIPISDHEATLSVVEELAGQYFHLKEYEQAEQTYKMMNQLGSTWNGEDSIWDTRTAYNLPAVLVAQKKYAEAEPILRQLLVAVESRTRPDGTNKEDLSIFLQQDIGSRRLMVETLNGLGKHDEADPIAKKAFALVDKLDEIVPTSHRASLEKATQVGR